MSENEDAPHPASVQEPNQKTKHTVRDGISDEKDTKPSSTDRPRESLNEVSAPTSDDPSPPAIAATDQVTENANQDFDTQQNGNADGAVEVSDIESEGEPANDDVAANSTPFPGVDLPTNEQPKPAVAPTYRRPRNASVALEHTTVNGATSRPAVMFIQAALEKIKDSKDCKRIPPLETATGKAIAEFQKNENSLPPPEMVLEPLRLSCATPGTSNELREVAIDTIGQLFSLNYLGNTNNLRDEQKLLSDAVYIVCEAWEAEGSDQKVEVQIIKALTAAIVNEEVITHGAVLMKAVRQVYHIFVVTRSQGNQALAQVSLTQMVQAVFDRVKQKCMFDLTVSSENLPLENTTKKENNLTLEEMQNAPVPEFDEAGESKTDAELTTQDAALLFRTLCRLSMKPTDESDTRGQHMKSKLLSLHLVHTIMRQHISVFKNHGVIVKVNRTDSEPFSLVIKPYLRQMLAQSALSPNSAVFEITTEIFWLVLANLRSDFKHEIAVLFTEVYFPAMDMKSATMHQKQYFMTLVSRICTDPRLLVELYLNYDCDPQASNVFEKLVEFTSRLSVKSAVEPEQPLMRMSIDRQKIRVYDLNAPPSAAIAHLDVSHALTATEVENFQLKLASLESLVNVLRSLVIWSQRNVDTVNVNGSTNGSQNGSGNGSTNGSANNVSNESSPNNEDIETDIQDTNLQESTTSLDEPKEGDDPERFALRKSNKKNLDAAIQAFNFSPKRGLAKFAEFGLLSDPDDPKAVAKLLLSVDGLDKAVLGEFMGKNDEFNKSTMAQFVDAMQFKDMSFVSALRQCLQRFRLPGEGQVVDRYMQAFAKKYYDDNSIDGTHPDFASDGSAWVLAMSVMMLNTDLHSVALRRRRMTDDQFVRNNKGMNDGVDFRGDLLLDIYKEIKENEIKLDSEQTDQLIRTETYDVATDALANRAIDHFKTSSNLEYTDYYNASSSAHISPMFEQCWLAVLAGISGCFTEIRDPKVVETCLEGLELALSISCRCDLDLAKQSFVQTLSRNATSGLQDLSRMNEKHIGSLRALLRVALVDGDNLKDSWYDILKLLSLVDQAQLAQHTLTPTSNVPALSIQAKEFLNSSALTVSADRIFVNTQAMTDDGALYFVKALSRISLEEIEASINQPEPRLFGLQKLVDVCYYNAARIRMGWSALWNAAMTEQFSKVLVLSNEHVVSLAIDSLRQLSIRFLEQDEMPHFAFQQEFLYPFVHVMGSNESTSIRVLALECLTQIVITRHEKLKSGWRAIFDAVVVPTIQAKDLYQQRKFNSIGQNSLKTVLGAAYNLLESVPINNDAPPGFVEACELVACQPEAKSASKTIELLHQIVTSKPCSQALWRSIYHAFSATATNGCELEVRSRSLEMLNEALMTNGAKYTREDWDFILNECLAPLFAMLHQKDQVSDEFSLWLSSTLIQAIKSTIVIFNTHFEQLRHTLDSFFLELLESCLLQNDNAVSRIGNLSLQQLIHDNCTKFNGDEWHLIGSRLVKLLKVTTAHKMLDKEYVNSSDVDVPALLKEFTEMTVHALFILETVNYIFLGSNSTFNSMPMPEILRVLTESKNCYVFARSFNREHELRIGFYKRGFVKHTPNLLLQECMAMKTYISAAMRLFKQKDRFKNDADALTELTEELIPLCLDALHDYNKLHKLGPVYFQHLASGIRSMIVHISTLNNEDFRDLGGSFYVLIVRLLDKDLDFKMRLAIQNYLRKFGKIVLEAVDEEYEEPQMSD